MLDDIRVNESRNNALLHKSGTQALCENGRAIWGSVFGLSGCHDAEFHMVAAVRGFDCWPSGQREIQPKQKARQSSPGLLKLRFELRLVDGARRFSDAGLFWLRLGNDRRDRLFFKSLLQNFVQCADVTDRQIT